MASGVIDNGRQSDAEPGRFAPVFPVPTPLVSRALAGVHACDAVLNSFFASCGQCNSEASSA